MKKRLKSSELRTCLGRFATGVTVITSNSEGNIHGMTANAFMSLSLDPPLITVSIHQNARMRHVLERAGAYGITVLREDQEIIAKHFAGQTQVGLSIRIIRKEGIPFLADGLANIICKVDSMYTMGDHILFNGLIQKLWYQDGYPLIFYRGKFFGLMQKSSLQSVPISLGIQENVIED